MQPRHGNQGSDFSTPEFGMLKMPSGMTQEWAFLIHDQALSKYAGST